MIGKCYWITGLSATGKTTYSKLLANHFRSNGRKVVLLDGDELRQVFASETYSREERIALGMRYSRLCQLISDQGIDVIIAVIGLFKEIHTWNRGNISNYIEIFIDTSIDELVKRDPKKLYSKYYNEEIQNVAGLDLKVDYPDKPDVYIKWSSQRSIESMFDELLIKCKNIEKD